MRHRNPLVIAIVSLLGLALAGCGSMDPSDWFSTKKPLPGERTAVFPSGVPGVPQGVPPELVQGYQPPPEPPPQVVEAPVEPPKPKPVAKPKPKPKQVAAPTRPTAITVQRPQQANTQSTQPAPRPAGSQSTPWPAPGQPAAQSAPWPAPQQTASQPAQPQAQSPFPDPPAPGTFSR